MLADAMVSNARSAPGPKAASDDANMIANR